MTISNLSTVQITEVEGVRAVWAQVPGPFRAGLVVRVGSADETLPTAGTSHMLEHLALFGIGRPGDHSNGHVDQITTVYHCTGDEALVRQFLGDVTRQLADPPMHRLAAERGVLRAEAAGRRSSIESTLLTWRYGAAGFGLLAQEQLGVERVNADALRAWSHRYATRGNSVLWFTGPPPAGLAIGLPDGVAVPPPDARPSLLPEFPAWFSGDPNGIGLHAVLDRSWANLYLEGILGDRLLDELRVRRALTYSPFAEYRLVSRDTGWLLAGSDLVDGHQTDAARLFLATLADLGGTRPPTEDELATCRRRREASFADPMAALGLVTSTAWKLLVGSPVDTPAAAEAGFAAVTPDDVAAAARQALSGAVAVVPRGVRTVREPWTPAPSTIHDPLEGQVHAPLPGGAQGELVVAVDGVTRRSGSGHVTVPVANAVAVQRWADGLRVLVADDATRLTVEPTLWENGAAVVARVDELYPEHLVVEMGQRPVDEIPKPSVQPSEPEPAPAAASSAGDRALRWVGALVVILVVIGVVGVVSTAVFGAAGPLNSMLSLAAGAATFTYFRTRLRR